MQIEENILVIKDDNYEKDIQNYHFKNCKCIEEKFEKFYFTNVIFQDCDFSNTNFSESNFVNCNFTNCKLVGIQVYIKQKLHKVILNIQI